MNFEEKLTNIRNKNNGKEILLNYYNEEPNFGDDLNTVLINRLFGLHVKYSDIQEAQMQAIGSILEYSFFRSKYGFFRKLPKIYQNLFKKNTESLNIWGTGFIRDETGRGLEKYYNFRNLKIYALRGKKTLNKLKTFNESLIRGKTSYVSDKIVFADPGLLAPLLLDNTPNKKYEVGIIPHYIHLNNQKIIELSRKYENSIIINVTDNPLRVVEQIAKCKCILSSSLHGLIVADSFCIPNQWIHISKLQGGFFKFHDYYSAFNLKIQNIDLNTEDIPNIDLIKSNYKITKHMITKKQEELIQCFPYQ